MFLHMRHPRLMSGVLYDLVDEAWRVGSVNRLQETVML